MMVAAGPGLHQMSTSDSTKTQEMYEQLPAEHLGASRDLGVAMDGKGSFGVCCILQDALKVGKRWWG